MIKEKECQKCHVIKPLGHFNKSSAGRSGRQGFCKQCQAAYNREYRLPRRDYLNKKNVDWHHRTGGHVARQKHLASDNENKAFFRDYIARGGTLRIGLELLDLSPLRLAAAKRIARSARGATADELLSYLYGDDPDPGERPRSYNTMKRMIYSLRREFENTGFRLVNDGYGKGYRFERDVSE